MKAAIKSFLAILTCGLVSSCGGDSVQMYEAPAPEVRASRLFSGPGEYPPEMFAAYGVVAFQAQAADEYDTARYVNICEGFVAAIPGAKTLEERGVPIGEQMATVWPLTDSWLTDSLNDPTKEHTSDCKRAVSTIDLVASRDAITKASRSVGRRAFSGRGPFVIAWSPSDRFGQPDVPVLVMDFSDVTTRQQATELFTQWTVAIEKDPTLWTNGWNVSRLKIALRLWADRWGPGVLIFLNPQNE